MPIAAGILGTMAFGKFWWAGLAATLCVPGCARRIYYTQPMRDSFEMSGAGPAGDKEIAGPDRLQYFAASKFILQRTIASRQERVAGGRVVVRKGRMLEQVIVRRGTPGVAVDWGKDWVSVSFEKGSALTFERWDEASGPAEDRAPAGFLGGSPPSESYRLRATRRGEAVTIDFEGKTWDVVSDRTPRLKVRRRFFNNKSRRRRVLRGRRL